MAGVLMNMMHCSTIVCTIARVMRLCAGTPDRRVYSRRSTVTTRPMIVACVPSIGG